MTGAAFAYFRTPRLSFYPVTEADPHDVVAGIGNYDVARWLGRVPYPYGPDDARAFIEANRDMAGKVWFISDGEGLVGGISIDRELGYWFARQAWGMGYATEAANAVIDVHFADPEAAELVSGHYPGNDRSARVLNKLGFRYTGKRKVMAQALAQTVESHEMRLSRAAWQARRWISLETARLRLRPLSDSDWRRLQQFGGVPEVARMMPWLSAPWAEEDVKRWIALSRFQGRPGYRLGIEDGDGRLIGTVGLGADMSVSFMLDRRFWGRGLATEAVEAFLSDAFARFPEVRTLVADHFTDNAASGRVLEKLGFVKTGTGLGASRARADRAPNIHYRLDRPRPS